MSAKTKDLCEGCYNDYYNHYRDEGCWMFADAQVTKLQRVGTWQPPPYSWHPETRLTCYGAVGYAMLSKDDCRLKHNCLWKKT